MRINADAGSLNSTSPPATSARPAAAIYTPDPLVQCLLDSAEPVIAERLASRKTPKEKEPLLSLKVAKAAGSGHFIIRAGHRIARHSPGASGEEEPALAVYRTAPAMSSATAFTASTSTHGRRIVQSHALARSP